MKKLRQPFKRLFASRSVTYLWMLTLCMSVSFIGSAATTLAAEPRHGDVYRTSSGPPRSLDPHIETYPATTIITNNTYNTLLRYTPDLKGFELDLLKSYRQLDNLTYEFTIHKGVRFHNIPPVNGRELTSADVKYSIERIMGIYGKKAKFKRRYYFEDKLASIETPDRYTVIVKTKEPYGPFMYYIASPWSSIVAREAVEEYRDLKKKAIGTGPFILKEFVRGSHITLDKNPNYFKKGLPYLDKIHIKIMRDPASILSAFLAHRIDATGVSFFQLPTIKKEAPDAKIIKNKGIQVWTLRCPAWIEGKKPLKPPFDKKKVRQAIAMAIDKQKLLNLAWGGYGTVQVGPVPNHPLFSLPESDQVEYNPEKAKKYLAEAGYPNGFSTELLTWNQDYMTKPAQVIQSMLKEVGINVTLKTLEMAQYFNRAYRFEYDLALHVTDYSADPSDILTAYYGRHSTYFKWSNREIWRLIDEQSHEMDLKKRIALVHKIQHLVLDDAPQIFLYTQYRFLVERPYVHSKIYNNPYQNMICETYWMDKH
ncbi:MAG: ABC transporter substrate-binding protein [Deltaproteobacteria bacterium]|nr:ABC transporter substrate-binding protein [Deltaproteobacteria bacterium]MBW2084970.1 ABC transporter substrate-binding protein [Deltaproteobacteria bacterium]